MAFQGTLETFYLSSLLQLLCNDKKTGVLRVNDGRDLITVTIKDGTIINASSTMQKEQLGALLRSQGVISSDELANFLQIARKKKQKLGRVLVDEGRIQPPDLQHYIRLQVENILYTLFLWQKGTFEYEDCTVSLDNDIVTELDTMEVVLEASRRVDEMSVLMRQVPDAAQAVQLSEHAQSNSREMLHPEEKAVLALIDGERTIKQIIEESGYDAFTVYKVLYSLISSGFVRSDDQAEHDMEIQIDTPVPSPEPPPAPPDEPLLSLSLDIPSAPLPESWPQQPAAPLSEPEQPAAQPSNTAAATPAPAAHKTQDMPAGNLTLEPPAKKEAKKISIGPLPEIPPALDNAAPLPEQPPSSGITVPFLSFKRAALTVALFTLMAAAASLYFIQSRDATRQSAPAPEAAAPQEPAPEATASVKESPAPVEPVMQQPPEEKPQDEPSSGMSPYQDPNVFFFVSLPAGYAVQDTSAGKKTDVLFTYPPNIRVKISARQHAGPWHAETQMYNTIALLQQPRNGFASGKIDAYSLLDLGGGRGYAVAASAYKGSLFCKMQAYAFNGYQKTVSIEVLCQNCRNPRIDALLTRIKESILKTFLLYP